MIPCEPCNKEFSQHDVARTVFSMATPKIEVIDTHVHLAVNWKDGQDGLPNAWLPCMGKGFDRNWSLEYLVASAEASEAIDVKSFVFVECSNVPAIAEAKWALAMAKDPNSKVSAVVAHIPVPDGAKAVDEFLDGLRDSDGHLPNELKGGRVVLLGDPMPPADICLDAKYIEGLEALQKHGLHWEWCCQPKALPAIAQVCAKLKNMKFVLDHAGHNGECDDFETWAPAIEAVAKNTNVVCKLGAIEEWGVGDASCRNRFMDHCLASFGEDRVIVESNWFVNAAKGFKYSDVFDENIAAVKRAGYTPEQINKVFVKNAQQTYRL